MRRHVVVKTPKHAPSQDADTQHSTTSGAEDEAEVFTETRMLQAPDGRPSRNSPTTLVAI